MRRHSIKIYVYSTAQNVREHTYWSLLPEEWINYHCAG